MRSLREIETETETATETGGGLFQNIKGFFSRKKPKPASQKQRQNTRRVPEKNTLYQKVKGKLKGLNKPPTSAPTKYPITKYPMFKGNERRDVVIRKGDVNQKKINAERFQDKRITLEVDTQTMNPATEDVKRNRPQDVVQMTLPIENVRDGMRRVYLFFYNKMRANQGLPLSPNPVYISDDEFNELIYTVRNYKLRQYPDELKRKMSFNEYREYTDDLLDKLAETIFGTPLATLNNEILVAEAKDHVFPSPADPSKLQFGERYGSQLGRYSPILFASVRRADHIADVMNNLCISDAFSDVNSPILTSFNMPYCICIFGGMDHFLRTAETATDRKLMCSHYLIVDPKYHPFETKVDTLMQGEYVRASTFTTTSYVVDAFKEQGVITMDEDLFKLLQKEAPQLVESSKVFLATADKFKYLKLYDHFMILTEKALPEGLVVTYKDPLQLAAVRRAFDEDREFLLADPYTAYCIKKKNLQLWSKAFGIKASPTKGTYWNSNFEIYALLRDVDKLFVDFCQYQLVLGKYLDLTQNSKSSSAEDNLNKASELYKVSLKDKKFLETMSNVGSGEAIFSEFKKIQQNLITYDTPLQTFEDVRRLIQKINPTWRRNQNLFEPSRRPQMRMPVPVSVPRERPGTLRLARVIPPLPESPHSSLPSLPSSPSTLRSDTNTSSVVSENEVPIPEAMMSPTLSKEQQIESARRYIKNINSELAKATPVYNLTRRKYRTQTNTNLQQRYLNLLRKPVGAQNRKEKEFLKNYSQILRNFSSHRNILLQTKQQQVDLLRSLGASP